MQALQTLSQREFEMMQCFWEADEPLEMKYLYKTVEQKRQVLYHPIVTKEDYYKHELREFQKRWNLNGIMRVI